MGRNRNWSEKCYSNTPKLLVEIYVYRLNRIFDYFSGGEYRQVTSFIYIYIEYYFSKVFECIEYE